MGEPSSSSRVTNHGAKTKLSGGTICSGSTNFYKLQLIAAEALGVAEPPSAVEV